MRKYSTKQCGSGAEDYAAARSGGPPTSGLLAKAPDGAAFGRRELIVQ